MNKGYKEDCNSFKDISILNVSGKALAKFV